MPRRLMAAREMSTRLTVIVGVKPVWSQWWSTTNRRRPSPGNAGAGPSYRDTRASVMSG